MREVVGHEREGVVERIINGVKGTWSEVANIAQEIFHDMIQSFSQWKLFYIFCEVLNLCSEKYEQVSLKILHAATVM